MPIKHINEMLEACCLNGEAEVRVSRVHDAKEARNRDALKQISTPSAGTRERTSAQSKRKKGAQSKRGID
jgi:hypothetical protein